jgi:hypothetical protein
VLGALVSGFFDHYWFNLTYPHMTVLFWLYVGLATTTLLVQQEERGGQIVASAARRPVLAVVVSE